MTGFFAFVGASVKWAVLQIIVLGIWLPTFAWWDIPGSFIPVFWMLGRFVGYWAFGL